MDVQTNNIGGGGDGLLYGLPGILFYCKFAICSGRYNLNIIEELKCAKLAILGWLNITIFTTIECVLCVWWCIFGFVDTKNEMNDFVWVYDETLGRGAFSSVNIEKKKIWWIQNAFCAKGTPCFDSKRTLLLSKCHTDNDILLNTGVWNNNFCVEYAFALASTSDKCQNTALLDFIFYGMGSVGATICKFI